MLHNHVMEILPSSVVAREHVLDDIAIFLSIGSRVNGEVRSRLSPGYNPYPLTYQPQLPVDLLSKRTRRPIVHPISITFVKFKVVPIHVNPIDRIPSNHSNYSTLSSTNETPSPNLPDHASLHR
jgi:hypothetical protein